jgi:hypothetical protein
MSSDIKDRKATRVHKAIRGILAYKVLKALLVIKALKVQLVLKVKKDLKEA